jgi:UDP-glucose 4-epimerase
MRVLITGVSGFAGTVIARTLARAGIDVVGVHRRDTPSLALLADEARVYPVRTDLARIAALPGPFEAVIHVAATSPAPGVSAERIVCDNVQGTLAVVAAAEAWGCRSFVFFSSLSLYGEVAGPVLDESSPIVNPDVYGVTKHLGELVLAERAGHLPSLALRLPGVLGPGAHRNWLSGVAAKLRAGQKIQAFHLDAPFNNAAHIADVAALVKNVIARGWTGFDAVVLSARGAISVRAVIERLAAGLGVAAQIEPVPPPKPSFTLSSQRAIVRWGYDPMDISTMIDRYAREVHS